MFVLLSILLFVIVHSPDRSCVLYHRLLARLMLFHLLDRPFLFEIYLLFVLTVILNPMDRSYVDLSFHQNYLTV